MSLPSTKRIKLSPIEPTGGSPSQSDHAKSSIPDTNETPDASADSESGKEGLPDASINHDDALKYWSSTPATVAGVLGGYPQLSKTDIQGSANFLTKLRRSSRQPVSKKLRRVVDCGAGIGRITEGLLQKVAERVDIVEPAINFCDEVRKRAKDGQIQGLGTVWELGLEAWDPLGDEFIGANRHSSGSGTKTGAPPQAEERRAPSGEGTSMTGANGRHSDADSVVAKGVEDDKSYDLIWNQWCLGQLNDQQLTAYLRRSIQWLQPHGFIVVKENLSNHVAGLDIFDDTDSSVTRTREKFETIFEEAGLKIIKTELQRGFPKEIYPVRMWGLRPTADT